MKLVVILAGMTRGGIDFFQSLLDKHSQISQLPGKFYIDEYIQKTKKDTSALSLARVFIECYPEYFNSKLASEERHNSLGQNKDEYYTVNKNQFTKSFIDLQNKEKNPNIRQIIINLNLAYSESLGENIFKKKLVVLQVHHISRISAIKNLDFDILFTIRNPIASHSAYISNLAFFDKKIPSAWQFNFHLERNFTHFKKITEFKKKTYVVKMEDVHLNNTKVMNNFCKEFGLIYEKSMKSSTFNGKLWWGDRVGKRDINGINTNFKNNINENLFFKKDIATFEYLLSTIFVNYNYSVSITNQSSLRYLRYLPFKFDYVIFYRNLVEVNLKGLFFSIYYYFKRIKFTYKKLKLENFPTQL